MKSDISQPVWPPLFPFVINQYHCLHLLASILGFTLFLILLKAESDHWVCFGSPVPSLFDLVCCPVCKLMLCIFIYLIQCLCLWGRHKIRCCLFRKGFFPNEASIEIIGFYIHVYTLSQQKPGSSLLSLFLVFPECDFLNHIHVMWLKLSLGMNGAVRAVVRMGIYVGAKVYFIYEVRRDALHIICSSRWALWTNKYSLHSICFPRGLICS